MARPSGGAARKAGVPLPSEQELALKRNYEARTNPLVPRRTGSSRPINITSSQLSAAASLMDRSQVLSPLAGPLGTLSPSEAAEAREFSDNEWDDFYSYDDSGYNYDNRAGNRAFTADTPVKRARRLGLQNETNDPAPITVSPTSTTNPDRPRTIAAGYDEERQVLTVLFRDGTYYNYYKVEPRTWQQFKASYSKGKYVIPKILDGHPRGVADMSGISPTSREELYRINRTAQWISDGLFQYDRLAPRLNPTKSRTRSRKK